MYFYVNLEAQGLHVNRVPACGSKKFLGLLELELQEVVNHTSWMLGTVRVVCVCTHIPHSGYGDVRRQFGRVISLHFLCGF